MKFELGYSFDMTVLRPKEETPFDSLPTITLDGVLYELVTVQRSSSSAIYKSLNSYLRIGSTKDIQRDLDIHNQMEAGGFSVAKLLSEGTYKGMIWYTEESLGDDHYGIIFKREAEAQGRISDETFDGFTNLCVAWAKAQLASPQQEKDWDQFGLGVHLDLILQEMPEEEGAILARYEQVKERLGVFPFTISHGDFGSFNICPRGVIDLESSFYGPAPYDVGSLVINPDWFPTSHDYEYFQLYAFSSEQKDRYLARIDALYAGHGLLKVSDYLPELNFLRGMWFVVRMHAYPKLQQFRYARMKELLNNSTIN